MYTEHRLIEKDSRGLSDLRENSVDLVVTSPPYPMIEMWDNLFSRLNSKIGHSLHSGDNNLSFELMHQELDKVWDGLYRVMKDGSFVCINIGDAARKAKDRFQLFTNHARIQNKLFQKGFDVLPSILWRKQTNAPTKFMGSGMLPAGAYVTMEHEYILIFRKGKKREFASIEEKLNRMESALFWEERNMWYSDIWEDLKGTKQTMDDRELKRRSAAYPFLLPYRLINMYSVFGDTILDPFLGTGTTAFAAMACGRNSIGYEQDPAFAQSVRDKASEDLLNLNNNSIQRIKKHLFFINNFKKGITSFKYINDFFGFPVMTRQETKMKLKFIESVRKMDHDLFRIDYLKDQDLLNMELGKQFIDNIS